MQAVAVNSPDTSPGGRTAQRLLQQEQHMSDDSADDAWGHRPVGRNPSTFAAAAEPQTPSSDSDQASAVSDGDDHLPAQDDLHADEQAGMTHQPGRSAEADDEHADVDLSADGAESVVGDVHSSLEFADARSSATLSSGSSTFSEDSLAMSEHSDDPSSALYPSAR